MSISVRPKPDRRQEPERRAVSMRGRRSSDDREMTQRLGSAVVTLECRQCSRRTKVTVDQLNSSAELRCSGCGATLRANGEQLRSALAQLAARLNDRAKKDPSPDDLKAFLDIRPYGQPCAACGSLRVLITPKDNWFDCRCQRCGYRWACDDKASPS